jgi:hypothetical protein
MDLRIIEHLVQWGTTPGRVLPGKKWQVSLKLQRFRNLKLFK